MIIQSEHLLVNNYKNYMNNIRIKYLYTDLRKRLIKFVSCQVGPMIIKEYGNNNIKRHLIL